MFDWVDKHKRWIQIGLLVLIVPSFAFMGVNYYFQEYGDSGVVAKVAGSRISEQEFEQALRERQEQMRQSMQGKVDQAVLDSNEVRNSVINGLVDKRALLAHALHSGVTVTDDQLRKIVTEIPAFKDDTTGKFSEQRYEQLLRSRQMTPAGFEESVRQDLRLAQVRDAVSESVFVPVAVVDRLATIREQQREMQLWVLTPEQVRSRVAVTEEDVKAFYEAHKSEFRIPERVRVEYLVLTPEALGAAGEVKLEEVRAAYEKNRAQYETTEERRASHILLTVPKDAKPEAKAEVRTKAASVLDEARKAPKSFGELAKQYSQDPGSATSGGDLGFFARGALVKPVEDAVFAAKIGDIVGPIESQYGFHIIRIDARKAGEVTPFEKVRPEIESELRKQKSARAFAEAADTLQNLVYEQSDSLQPAADALKLEVQTSDWITRDGGGNPLLVQQQLRDRIFADDAVNNKRNTDAVEVAPSTLVAARVIDHKAADVMAFDDVKQEVRRQVFLERARKLVAEDGAAALARARAGDEKGFTWSPPEIVSLGKPGNNLTPQAARDVFAANPAKLPAFVGTSVPDGRFVIYRVSKVIDAPAMSPEDRKSLARQLAQIAAQQQFDAYLQSVKGGAGVEIHPAKVEKKANN